MLNFDITYSIHISLCLSAGLIGIQLFLKERSYGLYRIIGTHAYGQGISLRSVAMKNPVKEE
jgi:hypothetical protein